MRAFILVGSVALLALPGAATAQHRVVGGTSPARAPSAGARSTGAPSAGAPRSRAGGDVRARSSAGSGSRLPRITSRGVPAGAPGSWGRDGRAGAPYRSVPYGSRPYQATPRYPRPFRPHFPFRPHGGFPFGFGTFGSFAFGVPSVLIVTPLVESVVSDYDRTVEPDYDRTVEAERAAPRGKLLVIGGGAGAPQLEVEPVSDSLLRLRWSGGTTDVREVTLLLLDADRALIASQTVREAPYTALFDRTRRAAFAGVAVAYANGASTTTVVPLSPDDAGRD